MFTKSDRKGDRFSTFLRNFEAGMIADIKNIENFNPESDPLFDYVNEVAEHFWQGYDPEEDIMLPSSVPTVFADRFCNGFIDVSRQEKYLATIEVQDTIQAFGLDVSKFWYLCLCIKDYVDGQTIGVPKRTPTRREEIMALIEEMDKLHPEPIICDAINNEGKTIKILNGFKADGKAELTLKVSGSKHPIKVTDLQTISIVNLALSLFIDSQPKEGYNLLDSSTLNFEDTISLKDIYRIYLFDKFLYWFIRPIKANKEYVSSTAYEKVSLDKKLLISRMIFVLGVSDDESYFEEFNEEGDRLNFMKNNLKKYKKVKIPTHNDIYW